MLGAMLGGATECLVTPETHFKQRILVGFQTQPTRTISADQFLASLFDTSELSFWGIRVEREMLPTTVNRALVRHSLDAVLRVYGTSQQKCDATVWIDHTPVNIKSSLLLDAFYPDAKFIHIVRDPRAVGASVLKLEWGPNTPRDFAHWWATHMAHGLATEHRFGERCLRVRYEDILENSETALRRVCEFAEIAYCPEMLSRQRFEVPSYSANQHHLVGGRPDTSRASAWKRELHPLSAWKIGSVLGELIELFGYEAASRETPIVTVMERVRWRIGIGVQLVLGTFKRKRLRLRRRKQRKAIEVMNSEVKDKTSC